MNKPKVEYSIKFNPLTGEQRPYELWMTSDTNRKCMASYKTLESAKKSQKESADVRREYFDVTTPEFNA